MLRPGNATANDAADHATVIDDALAHIPDGHRHGTPILVRADSAGGTRVPRLSPLLARRARSVRVFLHLFPLHQHRLRCDPSAAIDRLYCLYLYLLYTTSYRPHRFASLSDRLSHRPARLSLLQWLADRHAGLGAARTPTPRRADHAARSPRRLSLSSLSYLHSLRSALLVVSPSSRPLPSRVQD